ncbi:MAG: CC/Se motif family (seleno)protein [Christensenellales bacterium]|jgi:hypothetical protein
MQIIITPEARAYLNEKGRTALRLDVDEHRSGGCAMGIAEPAIHKSAPRDPSKYHKIDVNGITVFVSFVLQPKKNEPIEIALQKVLGIRSLIVSGFDVLA